MPKQFTKAKDYIAELDSLLKKNKGSQLNIAYDTGSNIPYTIGGSPVRNATGLEGGIVPANQSVQQTSKTKLSFTPMDPYNPAQSGGQNTQGMSNDEFTQQILKALSGTHPQYRPTSQGITNAEPVPTASLANGNVKYSDGSIRDSNGVIVQAAPNMSPWEQAIGDWSKLANPNLVSKPNVQGIASYPNNRTLFNDGSMRYGGYQTTPDGIQNLNDYITKLFGGKRSTENITGEFDTTDPVLYPGIIHGAMDIGTGDLADQPTLSSVFDGVVSKIIEGDPTFGNRVFITLPTGETLIYNHLSRVLAQEGQQIKSNDPIGITGTTGHSTGPHLDNQYITKDGQLADLRNFIKEVANRPQDYTSTSIAKDQPKPGSTAPSGDLANDPNFQRLNQVQQSNPIAEVPQKVTSTIQGLGNTAANAIDQANLTGKTDIGVSEALRGDLPSAGKKLAATIDAANPTGNFDLGVTEALKGNPIASTQVRNNTFRNLGQTVANKIDTTNPTGKNIDFGVSELLRGDLNKAKQKTASTLNVMGNVFKQGLNAVAKPFNEFSMIKPVYGADSSATPTGPDNKISYTNGFEQATAAPGTGVQTMKQDVPGLTGAESNIFKKIGMNVIKGTSKLGEDTGSGQDMMNPDLMQSKPVNDTRDAFFKLGGAEMYKTDLNPGIDKNYKGALDTSLFTKAFFQDPNKIAHVFGNTYLAKPATEMYRSYINEQYPIIPGHDKPTMTYKQTFDGQEYQWEDVDPIYYQNQYNQSVRSSVPDVLKSDYTWQAPVGKASPAAQKSYAQVNTPVAANKYVIPQLATTIPQPQTPNIFKSVGNIANSTANVANNIYKTLTNTFVAPAAKGFTPPSKSSGGGGGGGGGGSW